MRLHRQRRGIRARRARGTDVGSRSLESAGSISSMSSTVANSDGPRPRRRPPATCELGAGAARRRDRDRPGARAPAPWAGTAAGFRRRASGGARRRAAARTPRRPRAGPASGSAPSAGNIRARHARDLAFKRHQALVAAHVGTLIDGHGEMAAAEQMSRLGFVRGHGGGDPRGVEARAGAHLAGRGEIDHQHAHRTVALGLQDERPSNLSAEPSRTREHDRFAEQLGDRRRIVVAVRMSSTAGPSRTTRPRRSSAATSNGRIVSSSRFAPARGPECPRLGLFIAGKYRY